MRLRYGKGHHPPKANGSLFRTNTWLNPGYRGTMLTSQCKLWQARIRFIPLYRKLLAAKSRVAISAGW